MGRRPRLDHPGALHHVTARGNARADIFLTSRDATVFLATLGDVVNHRRWSCFAYCLMPNHYHLVVETHEANLSVGMHALNAAYVRMFNAAHDRVGHVFQQRFHAAAIDTDEHLLEAIRYVALNPVRAGLAETPGAWQWSSYRSMSGDCAPPRWLARDRALRQFGPAERTPTAASSPRAEPASDRGARRRRRRRSASASARPRSLECCAVNNRCLAPVIQASAGGPVQGAGSGRVSSWNQG